MPFFGYNYAQGDEGWYEVIIVSSESMTIGGRMFEWLEQNREWMFSGLGIFAISGLVSFLSVIVTLWAKQWSERRSRKRLNLSIDVTTFQIPTSEIDSRLPSDQLRVAYKGIEYENLCQFSAMIKNVGLVAIEKQKLLFVMPLDTSVVERFEKPSRAAITVTSEPLTAEDHAEWSYTFDRLEKDDECKIAFLVDVKNPNLIKCEPRGVDNIDYIIGEEVEESDSDVEKLVLLISMFVFAGFIPLIGNMFQAFIVLISTPIIVRLVRRSSRFRGSTENVLTINGGVSIAEEGQLRVLQRSTE